MSEKVTTDLSDAISALAKPLLKHYGLNNHAQSNDKATFNKSWKEFKKQKKVPFGVSYRMITRACSGDQDLSRKRYISIASWLNIDINEKAHVLDLKK